MGVQLVASDQSRPLRPVLTNRFAGAANLDVSSAFFSDARGLAELCGSGPSVTRVVVSARYPTSPKALRELRDELGADVRVASVHGDGTFHEKLYLARSDGGRPIAAYLGSANWTQGGLRRNQEAGVLIDDPELLEELAAHFERTHTSAVPLSDEHLRALEEEHTLQRNALPSRVRDRGRMRWRWRAASGYILKQNGLSRWPFREGKDDYKERIGGRLTGGQTQREVYSTLEDGQEMIVSHIARRRDGSPDRLIYGRGIIRDLDPDLWSLPDQLRGWLVQSRRTEEAEFIARWPRIVWLDPVEFIAYIGDSAEWLWASDVLGSGSGKVSFQGGYRWLREENEWRGANEALDRASEHFGVERVEMDGIWWNDYLGTERDHPMYMTRQVIEELRRPEAREPERPT